VAIRFAQLFWGGFGLVSYWLMLGPVENKPNTPPAADAEVLDSD
jgi:hypothetical protein